MNHQPRVFISYRRDPSQDLAWLVHERLKHMGAAPFLDREDISAGRFAAIIEREIINCDHFLLILAPPTLESEWVQREVHKALEHDKHIVVLTMPGFDFNQHVPDELAAIREYHGIEYSPVYTEAMFAGIAKALGLPADPARPPSASRSRWAEIARRKIAFGRLLSSPAWAGIAGIIALVTLFVTIALPQMRGDVANSIPTTATAADEIEAEESIPMTATAAASPTEGISAAQTATVIVTAATPPARGDRPAFTLYRDAESLTLYVPQQTAPVNLSGLAFEVRAATGERITRPLEEYAGFRGLNYASLPTPICFRLARAGGAAPVVSACQIPMLLTQPLANADVFWHDSAARIDRSVIVLLGSAELGICPAGQDECRIGG
jgi:hypothetical protein